MKYRFAVASLIIAGPLPVTAQTAVTLYGVADAAIAAESTDAPGSSRRYVLNSGNQSSSRLGVRGTEGLGGDLKAIFNFEAGVGLDTGKSDSAFWGRRAIVGLEGGFGLMTLGREYTPIAEVAGKSDILGQGFYGSNLSAFTSGRLSRRLSNSVNYKTPSIGGVKGSLLYSAGEQETSSRLADVLGASIAYAGGALYAGVGYHQVERIAAGSDKEYAIGVGYKLGGFDLKTNYLVADRTGPDNKFEQVNFGVSAAVSKGTLFFNLQQNELESGAKGLAYAVAYSYPLSKRTNIYTSYAIMRNNETGVFGLNSSSTNLTPEATAPGTDPSALTIGLRHLF